MRWTSRGCGGCRRFVYVVSASSRMARTLPTIVNSAPGGKNGTVLGLLLREGIPARSDGRAGAGRVGRVRRVERAGGSSGRACRAGDSGGGQPGAGRPVVAGARAGGSGGNRAGAGRAIRVGAAGPWRASRAVAGDSFGNVPSILHSHDPRERMWYLSMVLEVKIEVSIEKLCLKPPEKGLVAFPVKELRKPPFNMLTIYPIGDNFGRPNA